MRAQRSGFSQARHVEQAFLPVLLPVTLQLFGEKQLEDLPYLISPLAYRPVWFVCSRLTGSSPLPERKMSTEINRKEVSVNGETHRPAWRFFPELLLEVAGDSNCARDFRGNFSRISR
jgi:hypothetical protein